MSKCLPLSRVLYEEYNHLYPDAPLTPGIADDLDQVIAALHRKERSALCISGGGIRSATFALGVIQGLARLGRSAGDSVLAQLDYLSTVSGGGYIGSWLSSWSARSGGIQPVIEELRQPTGDKLKPEPPPLRHLREFSNFLTPKLGLLSADTWTFLGTYFRNLVLMWLVLVPLFIGALAVPRLFVSLVVWLQPQQAFLWIQTIAVVLLVWALGFLAFTRPVGKAPPAGWIYSNGAFQLLCLLPLCLVAVALVIGHAWLDITRLPLLSIVWKAAAAAAFASLIYSLRYWRANARETRDDKRSDVSIASYTLKKQLLEIAVAAVSGALFGVLIYWFLGLFKHGANHTFPPMAAPNALAWLSALPPELSHSLAASYVVFGVPLILFALLLQSTVFVGGTSWFNEDFDREWWGRAAAWVFIAGIGWIVLTATAIYGPVVLHLAPKTLASAGGISGLFAVLAGKSGKTGANKKQQEGESTTGKSGNALLGLAVPLFVLVLLAALSLATTAGVRKWLEHANPHFPKQPTTADLTVLRQMSWSYQKKVAMTLPPPQVGQGEQTLKTTTRPAVEAEELAGLDHLYVIEQTYPTKALILVLGPILLSLLASYFIGVNRFSMHALYRDRLIRAYPGASNQERQPNPFTGFDPRDNIPMHELRPRPMHLVNMTLNLVAGENLAWQERKAESFTASPLHCGSLNLGYRPSAAYAGPRGMTLGTAVGISGAAASPNMGYHSSPALAFLLTFFNVRLGWWLGNPGPAGEKTYYLRNPRASLRPLLAEVFANTDARHPYVYLSDGGHFENLGFYEMVLRRCRRIIVSDAGADEKFVFEDLGNAIRKVYIDFGIRIRIDRLGLFPRSLDKDQRDNPKYCATGRIFYSDVDGPGAPVGEFVYIKPVFYGDEPQDIYNYAKTNETFPHQSTGDQWFSESQFESYRALGSYTVQQICEKRDPADVNTVAELIEAAQEYAK
jgi:patatin-like phospholipase